MTSSLNGLSLILRRLDEIERKLTVCATG